jgi:hypothetical protein
MSDSPEYSEGGNRIHRHGEREKPFEPAMGEEQNIEAISNQIEKYIGPPDWVFHEIISDLVHIDVHFVAPTPQRNFYTLVTSGMSDRPMKAPEGAEHLRYGELMICLPPHWKLSKEAFADEENYWPVRTLKFLARLPHEYDTWISFGHTIPNGDPAEKFPGTNFCCALIGLPHMLPEEFWKFKIEPDKEIIFYTVLPLYREEMDLKLKKGADALWAALDKNGVNELVDVRRKNSVKKFLGLF